MIDSNSPDVQSDPLRAGERAPLPREAPEKQVEDGDLQRLPDDAQLLAAIVEASHDAIISKNLDGIITSWNKSAERLFGYTAAEAVGRPILMLIPPDRRDEEPGILARIRAGERIEHFETVRMRKDGTQIELSLSISPVRNVRGAIIGASKIARDVTAQRRADRQLRTQEKLYRAIGESINYGIWVCDATGRRIYTSDSFLRLVGRTGPELSAQPWSVVDPAEAPTVEQAWEDCVRSAGFWEHEFHVCSTEGRRYSILARGVPIRDDDGHIAYWAGIHLDLSEFRRSQEELHERTRTLERVNRLSGALLAERDLDRIAQHVCDAAAAVTGARSSVLAYFSLDPAGTKVARWMRHGLMAGPDIPPNIAPLLSALVQAGTVRSSQSAEESSELLQAREFAALAAGEEMRSVVAVSVVSRTGEVLGALCCSDPADHAFTADNERILTAVAAQAAIAVDNAMLYSALARELEQHKHAEQALRHSERQLRLVTDNAILYLAQCDREHRIKFVNRPYAERFGRAPQEMIGLPLTEIVGPTVYALIRPHLDTALAGQRVDFELQIPFEHGGPRWMRMIHEPERLSDGTVIGLVAVITDITERKRVERAMEEARDKALAASRAKDDFLAALSHELRTPLNPVLLLASEAADDPGLPPRVRADFDVVRKNIELEARLIDDLLDLTRITRGKLPLTFGIQRLATILEDAVDTIRPEILQKRLELTCAIEDRGSVVWGDAVRLQQVLWNVVKNAVKFTPEEGRVAVRLWNDEARDMACIEVVDSGIGMTESELGRVFDAFAQGEHAAGGGSHRFGGLGLGLAISKMLTELHGGSIYATSPGRNKGSRFVVEIPRCRTETDAALPPSSRAAGGPGVAASTNKPVRRAARGRRILLVEDHDPTRAALAQLLVRRHHEVCAAATVAEAKALAEKQAFELVISDVGLPDGNGNDLMAELRRARPETRGIALTGYGMDHDVLRSQEAGFVVHLTKPVTIQSLDDALAAALKDAATTDPVSAQPV